MRFSSNLFFRYRCWESWKKPASMSCQSSKDWSSKKSAKANHQGQDKLILYLPALDPILMNKLKRYFNPNSFMESITLEIREIAICPCSSFFCCLGYRTEVVVSFVKFWFIGVCTNIFAYPRNSRIRITKITRHTGLRFSYQLRGKSSSWIAQPCTIFLLTTLIFEKDMHRTDSFSFFSFSFCTTPCFFISSSSNGFL